MVFDLLRAYYCCVTVIGGCRSICLRLCPLDQNRVATAKSGGPDLTAKSRDIMLTPVVRRRPAAMVISSRPRKSRSMHLNVMTVRRGPLGSLELVPVGCPAITSYEGEDSDPAEGRDSADDGA